MLAIANSKTRAVRLYKANLRISQAFDPLLGALEVALRNRVNTILAAYFNDADWIINQKAGFMSDPSLTHIDRRTGRRTVNDFLISSVEKSERRFRQLGVPITSGKIIADQMLGFWTDLFEVHHYRLLHGRPIQIFNYLPPRHGRREICDRLQKIRQFRNRINHNEPICFNSTGVDFTFAEDVHNAIKDIFAWMDPELGGWVSDLDSIPIKIANAKRI